MRNLPDSREDLASSEVLVRMLANDELASIARLVAATAGLDLARYDRNDVERRILRRVALAGHLTVDDYRAHLASDPLERRRLARDLLPTDTAFFADPGYFEVLRRVVIEPLVRAADGGEIRIWVAGCGTGEEVYSLAMLFLEAADALGSVPALSIFATDVDLSAIEKARSGFYAASIGEQVAGARLRSHFVARDGGYEVRPRLRDLVCFGAHDLVHDVPLSGVDLVSCRNLLRYLTSEAADRAVSQLCASLRPGGHLFLGATEAPRSGHGLEPVSPLARVYRRGDPHATSGAIALAEPRRRGREVDAWLDEELERTGAELESAQEELRLVNDELDWARRSMRRAEAVAAADERRMRHHRRAEAEVTDANHRMDQYLGMLGHELRNPLAAILAASDVLAGCDTHDPVVERTQAILARQTGHMARIVDGLLDVSRIARGKIELDREVLDLGATLAPLVADFAARATARGLVFVCPPPEEPLFIEGDRVRLFQIVDGMLSNALKFTPAGGTVRLFLERDHDDAVIRVEDTGQGIDPALLRKVFEPFWQGPQSYDRARGGLGLGLALVRGLVALHGGLVTAHSDGADCGTALTVRLPRVEAALAAEQPRDEAGAPLRVLVVEDNVDAAIMVVELLAQAGHQPVVAHDGPGALEVAMASKPDVVVCDLGLPGGMNGYDVARALRREPTLDKVRLVALSGYGRPEDKAEAERAGFDLHLTKPVDFRTLSRALSR